MEISEKNKRIVVGLSILTIGGISLGIILYHYRKPKELDELDEIHVRGLDPYDELGYDRLEKLRMPKLEKSRWRNTRDEMLESGIRDVRENYKRRSRFTIYDSGGNIEKRFKVLKTVGDGEREKGRLRVSGNIYRKDTPSGYNYNRNNRNPNFTDLIIP